MTKEQFILDLEQKLKGLPEEDRKERIAFYTEMIDDRIEDGMSEEEAVLAVISEEEFEKANGSAKCFEEDGEEKKDCKRKMKTWEIVLLILGFPLWFPLLISAVAVVFSLYVVIWSLVVSLWAIGAALAGVGIGGIAAGIAVMVNGSVMSGLALIGLAIASVGLSIFMFFGCREVTKGTAWLTKLPFAIIKKNRAKREEVI